MYEQLTMNTTKNNQMSIASKIGFPIVMVAFVAMSSGCMTTFSTSSYEASPKPDSDIRQTHFMVESVTFYDHGDGKTIKDALRKLESGQNKSLIPVPYSVTVSAKSEHIDQGPVNGFLGVISLTVWPLWDGTRTIYGIRTKVLEDSIFAKGTESDTTVYGWLMLPTGVLGSLLLRDHIDFRSGSFEERIAKAAFGTLTKNRYDSAISGMTSAAKKRLKEGAPLSSTDERLLAMFPDPTLAMARAKHPGDLAKSTEALKSISDMKSLVDIAVHAKLPEIRRSAAMKVTGLSESEYTELIRSSGDPCVEEVFLNHVSSSDMLAEIVGCEKVDESVRQKALDKISNPAVLAGIAKSANNATAAAKEAAVAKLFVGQEEESLYDVALNAADKSIRESAFSKIETPSFIKRMATESKDIPMRLAALERIEDPEAVKEVAKTDGSEDVRIAALSRVSDQTFLKEVVDSDSSPKVHAAAIAKIMDEATLCEIAKSDADDNIRRSVLDRIYDKPTILSMAENDPEASIRLAAIKRMNGWSGPIFSDGKNQNEEQAVFTRIALNDSNASVRAAAIRLVQDEHVLVRVAKTDADPANRTFAVSHISDSEILHHAVLTDPNSEVRRAAISKIGDASVLSQIAQNDVEPNNRIVALGKITDATIIANIAKSDANSNVRKAAVERTTDQETLLQIAKSDADSNVRKAAAERTTDQETLLQLARTESNHEVKCAIIRRLSKESKWRLATWIRKKATTSNILSLGGFRLGMDESDARVLFELLLPNSSFSECASLDGGRVVKFQFSALELSALIGNPHGNVSIDDLPYEVGQEMGISFRDTSEKLVRNGVVFARQNICSFTTIGGETLKIYLSQWEQDEWGVSCLIDRAELDAPYDDPGFYVLGFKVGLQKSLKEAEAKCNPDPGTLIWERN